MHLGDFFRIIALFPRIGNKCIIFRPLFATTPFFQISLKWRQALKSTNPNLWFIIWFAYLSTDRGKCYKIRDEMSHCILNEVSYIGNFVKNLHIINTHFLENNFNRKVLDNVLSSFLYHPKILRLMVWCRRRLPSSPKRYRRSYR